MSTHVRSHWSSPALVEDLKAGTARCFIFNTGQVTSCLPKGLRPATSPAAGGGAVPVSRVPCLPRLERAGSPAPTHLTKHRSPPPLWLLEKPHAHSRAPSVALGPVATAPWSSESTPPLSTRLPCDCTATCPSRRRHKHGAPQEQKTHWGPDSHSGFVG